MENATPGQPRSVLVIIKNIGIPVKPEVAEKRGESVPALREESRAGFGVTSSDLASLASQDYRPSVSIMARIVDHCKRKIVIFKKSIGLELKWQLVKMDVINP